MKQQEKTPSPIDQELLDLLVCPEDHTPLRMASTEVMTELNRAIAAGTLKNRLGEVVQHQLSAGLVREDGMLLYPVVDDIPVLLIDEAIPLEGLRNEGG